MRKLVAIQTALNEMCICKHQTQAWLREVLTLYEALER